MTKTMAPPTWRDDYKWGFRVTDDGRIEPLTKREAGVHKSTDVFARSGPLEGLRFAPDRQPFKSNWCAIFRLSFRSCRTDPRLAARPS